MVEKALTPEQAAERLQVSVFTVQEWLREGRLKGFKAGRLWRIREADLDEFIQSGGKPKEEEG
jgi:excisionase family DNA binding protein